MLAAMAECAAQLDLRGVKCPLNWARARVVLDELRPGDRLALLLDDPRAVRDIPVAAEACGFAPEEPEALDGHWRLVVEV
jgi:TusA-related sulfurtransferase